MLNYGFSSLSKNLNLNSNLSDVNDKIKELEAKIFSARVTDIILDNNHPKFKYYGNWNSIGVIEFEFLDQVPNNNQKPKAYPLFPFIKNYPLINEIILVFQASSRDIDKISNLSSFYYISSLNIWNNNHHNAYPNPFEQIEGNIKLNSSLNPGTFVEKNNIHPLLSFAGDIIFDGRFGNSIRIGSTAKNNLNNWSSSGENGDPILILRNGQFKSNNDAWVPQTENSDNDISSLYLTSTQILPIETTYDDFSSFDEFPSLPKSYNGAQALLSSERVILNAKKDGIILSGNKFISLNSFNDVGINSKGSFIVNSLKISLGDKEANQQLILGNKLLEQLSQLTQVLINVTETLENTLQYFPGGEAAPHPASVPLGIQKEVLKDILIILKGDKLLSKVSRTI